MFEIVTFMIGFIVGAAVLAFAIVFSLFVGWWVGDEPVTPPRDYHRGSQDEF